MHHGNIHCIACLCCIIHIDHERVQGGGGGETMRWCYEQVRSLGEQTGNGCIGKAQGGLKQRLKSVNSNHHEE